MTVELRKTAIIPVDLHKWPKVLAAQNNTTMEAEHERILREAQALRQQTQGQPEPEAAAQ